MALASITAHNKVGKLILANNCKRFYIKYPKMHYSGILTHLFNDSIYDSRLSISENSGQNIMVGIQCDG